MKGDSDGQRRRGGHLRLVGADERPSVPPDLSARALWAHTKLLAALIVSASALAVIDRIRERL
jgi:hypothetical protein